MHQAQRLLKSNNFCAILLFLPSFYLSSSELDSTNTINTMVCTDQEVRAYMKAPDEKRQVIQNFIIYDKAYKSLEMKKSENDPESCVGALYGDIANMGEELKKALNVVKSLRMPSLSGALDGLSDKLSESICKRVQTTTSAISDEIINGEERLKYKLEREIEKRYGERALEEYVNDNIIPVEFKSNGVIYRNNGIDPEYFRNKTKERWRDKLEELKP
jgi:hypothetical protein